MNTDSWLFRRPTIPGTLSCSEHLLDDGSRSIVNHQGILMSLVNLQVGPLGHRPTAVSMVQRVQYSVLRTKNRRV